MMPVCFSSRQLEQGWSHMPPAWTHISASSCRAAAVLGLMQSNFFKQPIHINILLQGLRSYLGTKQYHRAQPLPCAACCRA